MKILMGLALLMTVAGIVLGDAILCILGGVSLANAGTYALVRHYEARYPVLE